jgi:hypothetical protein
MSDTTSRELRDPNLHQFVRATAIFLSASKCPGQFCGQWPWGTVFSQLTSAVISTVDSRPPVKFSFSASLFLHGSVEVNG